MSMDDLDIPEALRKNDPIKPISAHTSLLLVLSTLAGLVLLGLSLFFLWSVLNNKESAIEVTEEISPSPTPEPSPIPTPEPIENVLGHLPYSEAPQEDLVSVTSDGRIRMRKSAAQAFQKMQADARVQGIILAPISGFRTLSEQNYLFFQVKQQRNQETSRRAEVSAPPGYSEHHTGYAIDIGDGKTPATHLTQSFENTEAFRWLKENAARYSFELSFPLNNPQGISYEPWHWRYVGDQESLETFYKAQQLKSVTHQP